MKPSKPAQPASTGPVLPYFRYAARPLSVMMLLIVALFILLGVGAYESWSDRLMGVMFAFQMFVFGLMGAPMMPVWQSVKPLDVENAAQNPQESDPPMDGF